MVPVDGTLGPLKVPVAGTSKIGVFRMVKGF
uniref:Uncharacterized protein n=1 Tax=Myoviridae sp. ctQQg4 TaxID=2827686 RepID=A0A8S5T8P1_9CAUD|nr:MAG TPA: hypothetical protein [Myoviridae sp. ctQQg4]